jgi:hypothetical protein
MKSFTDLVYTYKQLLEQGDNMTVIDTFYDEQIVQIENDQAPVVGKQTLRNTEEQNLSKVISYRQQITSILIDKRQQIVMGEMTIEFTSKQAGPKILNEAFIQHWKNGKIIFQRFYYGGFLPGNK